jgi:hypothetical protein
MESTHNCTCSHNSAVGSKICRLQSYNEVIVSKARWCKLSWKSTHNCTCSHNSAVGQKLVGCRVIMRWLWAQLARWCKLSWKSTHNCTCSHNSAVGERLVGCKSYNEVIVSKARWCKLSWKSTHNCTLAWPPSLWRRELTAYGI